jgi:hypothetical protein
MWVCNTLCPLSHSSLTSSTSQTANLETLTSLSLMMNPPVTDATTRQNNEPKNNANLKTTLSVKPSRKLLMEPRFNSPLSDATSSITATSSRSNPHPYSPNLNPKPSTLRPHCFAKDRLRMWIPSSPSSRSTPSSSNQLSADINPNISDDQLNRILDVISASWTEKTKETYGSGLLIFHIFCDLQNIAEDHRCPASPSLISSFLASCAGAYSGSALSNCTAGLRAWHLLHGQPWNINQNELHSILEGASRLAPSSSKRPKRIPVERDLLLQFLSYFDLDDPQDAAIFACLVITFYTVSRLGEFTVPAISKFQSSQHITRAHCIRVINHDDTMILSFNLPATKCSRSGETTQCARLKHPTDPVGWLDNHFRINNPNPNDHLFAWKHPKTGLRPLTKTEVTKHIHQIVVQHKLPEIKGHSFRIGGTLHYLLLGTPFNVVKTMGRWSGDSFTKYLRKHALILSPYLIERPVSRRQVSNGAEATARYGRTQ